MTRHLDLFEPFWNGYAPTCSTPFLGNQTIESYLRKSVAIATLQNERRNTQLADLVVGVTLDNKVFLDFGNLSAIVESGYEFT